MAGGLQPAAAATEVTGDLRRRSLAMLIRSLSADTSDKAQPEHAGVAGSSTPNISVLDSGLTQATGSVQEVSRAKRRRKLEVRDARNASADGKVTGFSATSGQADLTAIDAAGIARIVSGRTSCCRAAGDPLSTTPSATASNDSANAASSFDGSDGAQINESLGRVPCSLAGISANGASNLELGANTSLSICQLGELRAALAYLRLTATAGVARSADDSGSLVPVAFSIFAKLEKHDMTVADLRSSQLGKEVNLGFWREHDNEELAKRSCALVSSWKILAARRKNVDGAQELPNLDTVWAEVIAACCAQDVERAAWLGCMVGPRVEDLGLAERLRGYKAKVRFLAATLRRSEHTALRQRLLDGEVLGDMLVERREEEFLSEQRREERERHRHEGLKSIVLREEPFDFFDESMTCPRCHHVGCKYRILRDSWALPRCGGNQGHMRKDTGKVILSECGACKERWEQEGVV